jgi:hypothetical protein
VATYRQVVREPYLRPVGDGDPAVGGPPVHDRGALGATRVGSDHEVRALHGLLVAALGSRHRLTGPFAVEARVVCRLRPPLPDCSRRPRANPSRARQWTLPPSTTAPARATRSRRSRLHRGEPRRLSSKGPAHDHQRLPYTEWCHCEACLVSAVPHFRLQTLLATVQRAELEERKVGPWTATTRDRPNQNLCCRRRGDRAVEVLCQPGPGREVHTACVDLAGLRRAGRSNPAGTVRSMTERSPMAEYPRLVVVRTSPHRRPAEAVASAGTPVVQGEGPGPEGLRGSE